MRQVQFDGSTFAYEWYRGQTLKGTVDCPIAFDTETQAIPPYRQPLPHEDPADLPPSPLIVPPVAVGMAFDGTSLYLIHPSRLAEFVAKNRNQQWVGQNFAFDFWVLMEEANRVGDRVTQEFLWSMGDANKFSDTAVLDLLVQLGTGKYRYGAGKGEDTKLFMANLAVLSEQYGCGELDKEDPYRLRFGEWVGLSEEQIEAHPEFEGFASYALKDVIATWRVYPHQRKQAVGIMRRAGWSDRAGQETYEIRPDALRLFGPLSEYLQVKGSIVLSKLSRTPVYIDQTKRAEMEAATRERYQKHMDALNSMIPVLFKRYSPKAKKGKAGQIRYNKKTGLPEMSTIILKGRLECEAETLGITPPVSKGKKKEISCSTKDWAQWADQSEFLTAWCGLGSEVKLMSFLIALDSPDGKAYSNYNLLMRTGRTSAQAHRKKKVTLVPSFNIQQMPRDSDKHPERSVRQLFRPPAGHKWYSNDYGYIELCSLASVCKARFGWSDMADIITGHRTKGGMDPHQTMAVVIMGLTPEQFLALPKTTQKEYRQKAKSCNFGFPGGLGVATFLLYAAQNYGVSFTPKEAKEVKEKWLELYPEMTKYLSDPTELAMRWQSDRKVAPKMGYLMRKRLSDYLRATDREREAKGYDPEEVGRFWDLLKWIAKTKNDPDLLADCEQQTVTGRVRNLMTYRACSLTGRVRNNVTFTAGANTPFQGLAGDGAKLALWTLMRKGVHLLGFVHDSIEVALPIGKEQSIKKTVDQVMVDSMQKVLGQGVPVAVDGAIGDCWSKA